MIRKKISMLGSFGVGKTCLVRRFVENEFSEEYISTIGVRVCTKTMRIGDQPVQLLVWDIHGEDEFAKVSESYLVGSSAYFLVIDPTRADTISTAAVLQSRTSNLLGNVPFTAVLSKADLMDQWEVNERAILKQHPDWTLACTSAKTGEGVETVFETVAKRLV